MNEEHNLYGKRGKEVTHLQQVKNWDWKTSSTANAFALLR